MNKQQVIAFLEEQRDARMIGMNTKCPSDFDKWQLEQAEMFREVIDWIEQLLEPTDTQLNRIKVKQEVAGFNGSSMRKEDLFVQVTKDEIGTSISINEYTIPFEPLGLEIIKQVEGEK